MTVLSASSPALQQLIAFSEALALGVIYAAVYDLYRSVRMQFGRLPAALTFIADCFFWVAAAVVTVIFMISRRWGEIHTYTYGGLACGFIVYFYFFSSFMLPLWQKVFGYILRPWCHRCSGTDSSRGDTGNKRRHFFKECRIFHFLWRK